MASSMLGGEDNLPCVCVCVCVCVYVYMYVCKQGGEDKSASDVLHKAAVNSGKSAPYYIY